MDTKIKINLGAIMKGQNKDNETNPSNSSGINKAEKTEIKVGNNIGDKKVSNISIKKNTDIPGENISTEIKPDVKPNIKPSIKNKINSSIKIDVKADIKTDEQNITPEEKLVDNKDKVNPAKSGREGALGYKTAQKSVPKRSKVAISLDEIEKSHQKDNSEKEKKRLNEIKKEEEKKQKPIIKEQKPKQELFSNYEATFTKKKEHIVEKIKKLKNLPKTRPLFISALIVISISGISLLFYIDPKNHSIDNYKTSIINIIDKNNLLYNTGVTAGDENINIIGTTYEKEKIKVGGLNFEFETELVNNTEILKYNGKTYNSLFELKEDIKLEVDQIKKEKLIKELIKFF